MYFNIYKDNLIYKKLKGYYISIYTNTFINIFCCKFSKENLQLYIFKVFKVLCTLNPLKGNVLRFQKDVMSNTINCQKGIWELYNTIIPVSPFQALDISRVVMV